MLVPSAQKSRDAIGVREVCIPTATAIVTRADDPNLTLIGQSSKHENPVLSGGKIDKCDIVSKSMEQCALKCIKRELFEEIGALPRSVRLLAVTMDSERDVRTVSVKSLLGSVVEQAISDLSMETSVTGRYGVPDYLFVIEIDPATISNSNELTDLRWIDCQKIDELSLGAGHGKFVRMYLESLRA